MYDYLIIYFRAVFKQNKHIQLHLLGWKKVAVAHRTWDVNECSKLGEKKITGGIKHQGTACKGYCNDFRKWKISNGFRVMANKCNAINYNPRTDKCIAWACITPIPFPTVFLPGFEAYTREEEGIKLRSLLYGYFI